MNVCGEPSAVPVIYKKLFRLVVFVIGHCRSCVAKHFRICLDAGCSHAGIIGGASLAMGRIVVYECIGCLFEVADYNEAQKDFVT